MTRNKFRIALIVSLALHGFFVVIVWLQPAFLLPDPNAIQSTKIDIVDAEELLKQFEQMQAKQGQIVSQSDTPVNNEKPKDAKFLSKHDQAVEKETRAALNDKFRNSTGSTGPNAAKMNSGEAAKATPDSPGAQDVAKKAKDREPAPEDAEKNPQDSSLAAKDLLTDKDGIKSDGLKGLGGKFALKDLKPNFKPRPGSQANGGGDGPSATDDHLNDVATGAQTLLNTREFVYYSYYTRIKDKLRQYWEPKIKEKMERIVRQGRTIASETERVTKVVIILDSRGTLVRVQVVGASGLVDLDDAAVEAFKAAAPFPNPPKGIVEKDGLIRIRWDFVLEA